MTDEEIKTAEKFHTIIERTMREHYEWFLSDVYGDEYLHKPYSDTIEAVKQYADEITVAAADNTFGSYGMSILHQLVTHNYYDEVKLLLEKGVNPNIRGIAGYGNYADSYKGVTPLHIACFSANLNMYKLLIEYGADDSLSDEHNRNCFHFLADGPIHNIYSFRDSQQSDLCRQGLEIAKLLTCDINQKADDGCTPFIYLMMYEERFALYLHKYFIDYGADIMAVDGDGNTTLILAAKKGLITPAYTLMQNKELLNVCNNAGDTALHLAYRYREPIKGLAIAYLLARMNVDYNIKNSEGITVKEYLDTEGDDTDKLVLKKSLSIKELKKLLSLFERIYWGEENRDINIIIDYITAQIIQKIDFDDDTEIEYLEDIVDVYENNLSAVLRLLKKEDLDINMNFTIGNRNTSFRDLCLSKCRIKAEMMAHLQKLGADFDEAHTKGCTPAYLILKNNINLKSNRIQDIEEGKIHPYAHITEALDYVSAESMTELNYNGTSALHLAATYIRDPYIIEYMIKRGVDINVTQDKPAESGNTPLHLACYSHNIEAVKALISAGADDSIMNVKEEIPAYSLFKNDRERCDEKVYEILEMLDTVDIPCAKNEETPMLCMLKRKAVNDIVKFIELFIEKGADIDRANNIGETPLLLIAKKHRDREAIKLLISEGADINACDEEGNNVLLYAILNSDVVLARYLIKKGANYNVINNRNQTPASIAIEKGFDSVLELMTDIEIVPSSNNGIEYED